MTAALLNRFLRPEKCRITLIEAADIGTIGVGEATIPHLVAYLRAIGIGEDEFMVATHGSYKLGIKFVNWRTGDDVLWHPFGQIGGTIDHIQLFHYWLKSQREGKEAGSFYAYSLQKLLSEMNKAPRALGRTSSIIETGTYAYHMDATQFARFLTKVATGRGVHRIVDKVRGVALDERG